MDHMKRFLIIGDILGDILPNDFAALWMGEAKDKDDALRQLGAKQTDIGSRAYKVIEIAQEYALPYDF